ncbi:MAG: DUF4386 domain-containing protein [Actinobacteria bacterium]|nr:DUF4386 domain-containing protein [Actinomycetota bacterium]
MDSNRRAAIIVGVLYIIGTAAGGLSRVFYGPILGDPNYLIKVSENQNIVIASLLVLTMAFSLAMMSVVLYPILKRYNEALALGVVLFRGALEAVMYIAAVINWLLLLIVSQQFVMAGAPTASYFQTFGTILLKVDVRSAGVLSIVFSLGALMIYYVFYKSKLIPRWLSGWGIIGAIPYLAAGLMALFGTTLDILMIPLAVQEMVMAVWLIVKGFNPSAIASLSAKQI